MLQLMLQLQWEERLIQQDGLPDPGARRRPLKCQCMMMMRNCSLLWNGFNDVTFGVCRRSEIAIRAIGKSNSRPGLPVDGRRLWRAFKEFNVDHVRDTFRVIANGARFDFWLCIACDQGGPYGWADILVEGIEFQEN